MKNESNPDKYNDELFLDKMKDKYNEEFTIVGGGDESYNAPYRNIYLYSASRPNKRIKARWNGKNITDNYVYILKQEDVETKLRELLDPIYDEYKVFFSIGTPRSGLSPEMTTEEFMKVISKDGMGFDICVQDENYMETKDENLEKVREVMKEKGYMPGFTILYMEPERLSEVNDENLLELFTGSTSEEWLVMRANVSIDDDYDFLYASWSEE